METTGISSSQSTAQTSSGSDRFQELDADDFLNLLIAELQNQDPTSPVESSEIVQQIGQIREIQSNESLVTTLDAIKLGQNMGTSTSMIGSNVLAMTSDGEFITGRVDGVTFEDGAPRLQVGEHAINLKNISAVYHESTESTEDTGSAEGTQ